jgi:hypothetical protein
MDFTMKFDWISDVNQTAFNKTLENATNEEAVGGKFKFL